MRTMTLYFSKILNYINPKKISISIPQIGCLISAIATTSRSPNSSKMSKASGRVYRAGNKQSFKEALFLIFEDFPNVIWIFVVSLSSLSMAPCGKGAELVSPTV